MLEGRQSRFAAVPSASKPPPSVDLLLNRRSVPLRCPIPRASRAIGIRPGGGASHCCHSARRTVKRTMLHSRHNHV